MTSLQPAAPSFDAALRSAGLRVTRPRLAVLTALHNHSHVDTATIIGAVRTSEPGVSHQAVYDCLGALQTAGLVRRIQPAGQVALYELQHGDNHHHLVCRSCRAVVDVECATGQAPCLHAADTRGYVIDEAEVTYWGLCPACSTRSAAQPIDQGQER